MEVDTARQAAEAGRAARSGAWFARRMAELEKDATQVADEMTTLGYPVSRQGVERWMAGAKLGMHYGPGLVVVLDVAPGVLMAAAAGRL